jgi:hypothetical protein
VTAYVSPWWPRDVAPPGDPRFRDTATTWLFTLLPEGYENYPVLRGYPSAAVALARRMLLARFEGTRHAYRTVAGELADYLPPHYLPEIRGIYRDEGVRLQRTARGLDLVDRAMRGEKIGPRSADAAPWFPAAFWAEA